MSDEPSPRRRRRGRGARERILKAATELFTAQGVNATGMDQLTSAGQVSKRTLYTHFAGKDDLVLAYLRELQDGLLPGAPSAGADPREQLRRAARPALRRRRGARRPGRFADGHACLTRPCSPSRAVGDGEPA
ncbi:TetR/AcrR family transcriptional regulator [Streptomyces sp. NPDC051287]|uniref:TetR/AcrR family transcriptional regulator n=1 Tax=Streptomyces sp. NPDC051287 TaxID=3365648 RepID=UPI00378AC1AC